MREISKVWWELAGEVLFLEESAKMIGRTVQQVSPNVLREAPRSYAYIHLSGMAYGIVVEGAVTHQAAVGFTGIAGEVPMRYPHIRRNPAKSVHYENGKKEKKNMNAAGLHSFGRKYIQDSRSCSLV